MGTKRVRGITLILLISIFLLALLLRGLAFMEFKDHMSLKYDPRNYWLMSHQLVDEGIYGYYYDGNPFGGRPGVPNARVMPGYPVFLAVVYKILGDKYLQITAVRLLQIMASSVSALLAFHLVRKIFEKDSAALLTAFFLAVYPTYIFSCIQLLTEVLALFTMLLYLCFEVHALESGKAIHNLLAGLAFGLHILVRPTLLPLFILPFIFALVSGKTDKKISQAKFSFKALSRLFALQLAGFIAIMLPWWVRNMVTLGSLIITAKASGNPLLGGTYPYFRDFFADVPDEIKGNNDLQMAFGIKRIIEGFKNDPWLYIKWFTIGKIGYTFQKPYLYNMLASTERIHFITHFLIIIAGVPGMIWHSIKSIKGFYFYLYGIAILGLHLLFIPDPRYAYQVFFFIMAGAAHFLVFLFEFLNRKIGKKERAGIQR